jgi:DNA primase
MAIAKNKEALRDRLDLVDVVSGYVQLKRASANSYKGLCPFHADKNPSMTVTPHMGLWQCWSCGAKGDVFGFVMQIENLDFPATLELLAAKVGFVLEYEEGKSPAKENNNRPRILAINQAAAEFFQAQLPTDEAKPARDNLLERGFDKDAAAKFGVGYSPDSFNSLTNHLKAMGFTDQELLDSTLVRKSEKTGGVYDFYRGRLMWPIRDQGGAVIGFGARKLLETDQGPKYYNSSDSPVYHKNKVLYGIDLAKAPIGKKKQVVVVEGYTDVMACHLAGVDTAIATCGTAFTEEHVNIINRLLSGGTEGTAEVIFCFDPDEAGQKAAMRAWEQSSQFKAQTFVAIGPDGLDPCDLRSQKGDEAVKAMIANRKPIYEFMVRQYIDKFDLGNVAGRVAAAKAAAPIIAAIRDVTSRSAYERELSGWVSLDPQEIHSFVEEAVRSKARAGVAAMNRGNVGTNQPQTASETLDAQTDANAGGEAPRAYPPINLNDPMTRVERQVLEVIVQIPDCYSTSALARILAIGFAHPAHNAIGQGIARLVAETPDAAHDHAWIERLVAILPPELHSAVNEIAVQPMPAENEEALARYGQGVIIGALDRSLNVEKNELLAELRRIDASAQPERFSEVNRRLVALEADRRALRAQG